MAHCGRCGAVLGEGKKFCGGCGAPVAVTAAPVPVPPVTVASGKSAAVPVMWVAGAIAVVALLGAGTWLAYPVLLKRFRPETPVVTAPVQAPSEPVQPPAPEPGKEPDAPAVQPPVTVVPPVDRGDGGREAEARRNAERLAAERAASERAAAERAAADRAAQERMAAERAASERAAADRLAQERLAQERVAAERLAQERAEQARLAREAEEKQQAARRAAAAGPRSGVLTWQGRLVKGEVVTITGTSASTGEVSGVALPGGAVLLQSGSGCTVSSAPVPSSGFKQFSFRCKQAGAVTAEFQWNKP